MSKGQLLRRLIKPAIFKFFLPAKPLSRQFGFDRGTPIDRYYIDRFIEQNKEHIQGAVLESGEPDYTNKFGTNVTEAVGLTLKKTSGTQIVADLSQPENFPENKFNCYICPQTLLYVDDILKAIESAYKVLKPGGVFLGTVPALSQKSTSEEDSWHDQWRFNSYGIERLFGKVFGKENIKVQAFGNVKVAAAFLYGLALEELSASTLERSDPDYECVITIFAKKC